MEHQAWQKYSKIKCCLYHIRMYMTGLKFLLYRLYGEVNRGWKHIRSRFSWPYISCVAQNICGSLFLRIGDFFVLRELIFATRTDWSTQYPALTMFSSSHWVRAIEMHILKQYYGVRQYFFVYRFVSERKRQAVREGTFFIGGRVGRGFGGEGP